MKLQKIEVSLPFGLGKMVVIADDAQRRAAWTLYVELITRVAIQPLDEREGLLREALNSLYRLFDVTRGVLKEAGPDVARGPESLGVIAIAILNSGLRPFLSEWHPKLLAYEQNRPTGVGLLQYERAWEHFAEMREGLRILQANMLMYADVLAQVSGTKLPLSGRLALSS